MGTKKTKAVIRGYKGFDKNMQCRGFQYEEGNEYEQDSEISYCHNGFHGCVLPHEVFSFYAPGVSRYHHVEMSGVIDSSDNSKIACSCIKIGKAVDIATIVKMSVPVFFDRFGFAEKIKANNTTTAGDYGAANAGDWGAANAGDFGAANAGTRGAASVGKNGVAIAATDGKVKGEIGSILVLVSRNSDGDIADYAALPVDGIKIKPGTWYKLKNGEFVEATEYNTVTKQQQEAMTN